MKFTILAILATSLLLSLASCGKLQNTLKTMRSLQAVKMTPKPSAESENDVGPEKAPDSTKKTPYVPMVVKKFPDMWKAAREHYYEMEGERLNRERAFHSAEFQRYVRQQKWNEDRRAIAEDTKKSIAQRVTDWRDLDEQARIDIDTLDAGIGLKQSLRNPQNREQQRAWRIFNEKSSARSKAISDFVNRPVLPKQGVEGNGTRRAQAKESNLNAGQKKLVEELMMKWKQLIKALQSQIDLNSKFHIVEFYQFAYDEHKLADMKQIFESDLPLGDKKMLWWNTYDKYTDIKAPAMKLMADSNAARTNAQNVVNELEMNYPNYVRRNKYFEWAK